MHWLVTTTFSSYKPITSFRFCRSWCTWIILLSFSLYAACYDNNEGNMLWQQWGGTCYDNNKGNMLLYMHNGCGEVTVICTSRVYYYNQLILPLCLRICLIVGCTKGLCLYEGHNHIYMKLLKCMHEFISSCALVLVWMTVFLPIPNYHICWQIELCIITSKRTFPNTWAIAFATKDAGFSYCALGGM